VDEQPTTAIMTVTAAPMAALNLWVCPQVWAFPPVMAGGRSVTWHSYLLR
jgi:hypothetical protein